MVKLKESPEEGGTAMSIAGSVPLEAFTQIGEAQAAGAASLLPVLLSPNVTLESQEFQYSLSRIVKGIASSRDSAREGYFSVLSILLKFRTDLSISMLLEVLNKSLKIGNVSKGETGELCTGHVLLCGAVIRSGRFADSSDIERTNLINTLLNASSKKTYLGLAAYSFISDFINQGSEQDVREKLWPQIQETLTRPLNEYSVDHLYCLLTLNHRYPSLLKKFYKKNLKIPALFSDETLPMLSEKLMVAPEFAFISHPVYEIFTKNLCESKYLLKFWNDEIETKIGVKNENKILISLTILGYILKNIGTNYDCIPNLLGDQLIPCILEWFKGFQSAEQTGKMLKIKGQKKFFAHENKGKQIITKSKEVFNILQETLKREEIGDDIKLEVLKKLLFNPGDIMFCDVTNTRLVKIMIEDLKLEGVKSFAQILKDVITGESKKTQSSSERAWTNMEKMRAAEMLTYLINHRAVNDNVKWRIKNMQFFIQIGFFKSSENSDLFISAELASSMKKSFYRCLTSKSSKLETLLKILSSLVDFIDDGINSNSEAVSKNTKLFSPIVLESWKIMRDFNEKLKLSEKKQTSKAVIVFQILSLHSGLFLFSDIMKPQMAKNSLEEIENCYDRYAKENKSKKVKTQTVYKDGEIVDVEPEWTEVLVDVFLSFLSRDSYLLRTVVQCVFRLLCEYLTPSAVGQILSVLDPDNDNDILHNKDEESDDDKNDSEDSDDENDKTEDKSDEESSSGESSDENEDENITVNDQLRMAVQKALGSAAPETDTESIDADDITEEEGRKLDNALSNAFKMLRKSKGELTKKDKKNIRSVMEFRIRVIDLLQIYLEKTPSMDICLGMISPLFKCLEFSIKDTLQKQLEDKVRKCLKTLYSIKTFSSSDDVTLELLADYLKSITDRGTRTQFVFQGIGDVITKCSSFIVRCSQKIAAPNNPKKKRRPYSSPISEIYGESLEAFFTKRDCLLPIIFFHDVLHIKWDGNWDLLKNIINKCFDDFVRQFRKNEGLEMINVFYTSLRRCPQTDPIDNPEQMKEIEEQFSSKIIAYLNENPNVHIHDRFFALMMKVLVTIKNYHTLFTQSTDNMDWTGICDAVQKARAIIKLKNNQEYFKFCNIFKLQKIKNSVAVVSNNKKESVDSEQDNDSDSEIKENGENGTSHNGTEELAVSKKKKKKSKVNENMSKKEIKMLRAQASSEGLQTISFTKILANSNMNVDDIGEEVPSDEDSDSKKKRKNTDDVEKPKKRIKNV